jgi:hypothetical protein
MKKMLLIVLLLAVPSMALAQDSGGPSSDPSGPAPRSWNNPDIFHQRAHVCFGTPGTLPCDPNNIVGTTFTTYIRFWAPNTQNYTRFYFITDVEGALIDFQQGFGPDFVGFNEHSVTFSLPGGVYKFISVIIGDNGKIAFSEHYRFRACSGFPCPNGP